MSSPKIVTSPTMYVGYQKRTDDGEEITLGFATYLPLNTTKKQTDAFDKRKSTVDSWHEKKTFNYKTREWHETGIETELLDNSKPLAGFKIARSVRRYGWGGGNVLWRIEDPRGFELEISSANMASVLDTSTLVHGAISGKCIWGWTGGKVVLLPEDSQPYKDAIATTKLNTTTISAKDVKIGDRVQLQNGTVGIWAGRLHYAEVKRLWGDDGLSDDNYDSRRNDGKSYLTFVPNDRTSGFLVKDDGDVYVISSPKFGKIIEANGGQSKEYGADLVNTAIAKGADVSRPGYGHKIVAVSLKKIDTKDLKLTTRPTEEGFESKRMIWWLEAEQAFGMTYHEQRPVMNQELLKEGRIAPIYVDQIDERNKLSMYHRMGHKFVAKTVPFPPFDSEGNYYDRIKRREEYVNQFEKLEVVIEYVGYTLPLIGVYMY